MTPLKIKLPTSSELRAKISDLIHPIYQKENQYSKHKNIWQINGIRAKGKYIALCDGDDY
jgi:hypothetical protein